MNAYLRFLAMLATSAVVMYAITYLSSWDIVAHARFSETRLFVTLMMVSAMAVVMLLWMIGMYPNRAVNGAILAGSGLLFAAALVLLRSQATVDDVDYMEAMIPHHSIAILTSERAEIRDPRVRELADGIVRTQLREIDEMNRLIAELRERGAD